MERVWNRCVKECADVLAEQNRYVEPKKFLADFSVYLFALSRQKGAWQEYLQSPRQTAAIRQLAQLCGLPKVEGYEWGEAFQALDENARLTVGKCLMEAQGNGKKADETAQIFRELLDYMISQGILTDFITPRPLTEFMARLLDPAPGARVLDPVCGSGGMLAAVMKQCGSCRLTGLDTDPVWIVLAGFRLLFEGQGEARLRHMDFFAWTGETFDAVLANPPYYDDLSLTVRFMEKIMEVLRESGTCAVLVPEGFLTSSGREASLTRRWILEHHTLEGVVALPRKIYRPYTESNSSLLLLKKGKRGPDEPIFMAKISEYEGEETTGFHDGYLQDMEQIAGGWMKFHGRDRDGGPEGRIWWETTAESIRANDYIFAADAYRKEQAPHSGRPLEELLEGIRRDQEILEGLLGDYLT